MEVNMDTEIVKAKTKDVETVLSIRKDAFAFYQESISPTALIDALTETAEEVYHQITDTDVYLLLDNQNAVGTIRVSIKIDGTAKISRFGFISSYRDKGLGSILLNYILSELKKAGIQKTYLYTALMNESLISFYKIHDFHITNVNSDRGYQRARMEIIL